MDSDMLFGHAVNLRSWYVDKDNQNAIITFKNSWGPEYQKMGNFEIDDLRKLSCYTTEESNYMKRIYFVCLMFDIDKMKNKISKFSIINLYYPTLQIKSKNEENNNEKYLNDDDPFLIYYDDEPDRERKNYFFNHGSYCIIQNLDKNEKYIGNLVYGVKHGFGTLLNFNSGDTFECNWKYDVKNGYGTFLKIMVLVYILNGLMVWKLKI